MQWKFSTQTKFNNNILTDEVASNVVSHIPLSYRPGLKVEMDYEALVELKLDRMSTSFKMPKEDIRNIFEGIVGKYSQNINKKILNTKFMPQEIVGYPIVII